jgi:ubiquinone/menaquinone biosynthesis C-methylase UbiE
MSRIMLAAVLVGPAICGVAGARAVAEDAAKRTPDVVYVGTPHDIVAKMLDLAKLKKDDVVYDLGCGDGRIVVMAAKQFGCRGVGFDINPVRIREALANVERNNVQKLVKIVNQDIFTVDVSEASVVMLYLLPSMNLKLVPQLEKLKPGSRIVAHDYSIQGYSPDKTLTVTSKEDDVEHYLYLWTAPLKKTAEAETKNK